MPMNGQARFDELLRDRSARLGTAEIDLTRFLDDACSAVMDMLQVTRVSVWQLTRHDDEALLSCKVLCQAGDPLGVSRQVLRDGECASYFAVLIERGVYACDDTRSDPVLASMRPTYLDALDIRSLLDGAFKINGRTIGVLCCEQTGRPRPWSATEVNTVRRISTAIALVLARGTSSLGA